MKVGGDIGALRLRRGSGALRLRGSVEADDPRCDHQPHACQQHRRHDDPHQQLRRRNESGCDDEDGGQDQHRSPPACQRSPAPWSSDVE